MFLSTSNKTSPTSQFLPDLIEPNSSSSSNNNNNNTRTSNEQQLKSKFKQQDASQTGGRAPPTGSNLHFQLPQLSNSALVHHRAALTQNHSSNSSPSVGDQLAAASAQTGASLPLMIGNRSKCVVNLLDGGDEQRDQAKQQQQQQQVVQSTLVVGPQNTALRAEQRRQNMSISVVRPVVVNGVSSQDHQPPSSCCTSKSSSHHCVSLIDDWMLFDKAHASPQQSILHELLASCEANNYDNKFRAAHECDLMTTRIQAARSNEHEAKQQALLMRREEHELNRAIRRQHEFIVSKLEQRRRHLNIVQSVWFQRDFKHAIEKLVDIYHQGLIFTESDHHQHHHHNTPAHSNRNQKPAKAKLKSLNSSLVVDVIGIIILRPKLWTLEICRLLLPIINNDLLLQVQYEYYQEVGLKALKLILAHFSSVIRSTLESLKESSKLVGIDLSREDRINKCLACYKLLLESQATIISLNGGELATTGGGGQCMLAALQLELKSMFSSFFSSIHLDSSLLAMRRFQAHR